MQTKWTAPSRETCAGSRQAILEELAEHRLRHLAGGHRELPVTASGIGMTADAHVVGRIQKGRIDARVLANDLVQEREVAAVAAADNMLAEPPDVAWPRSRGGRNGRDHVVLGILGPQQQIEFAGGEPGEAQIEIKRGKLAKLLLEQVEVPPGIEGDLVVGQAQGALLGLAQADQLDRRHLGQAQRSGRAQPSVAGDNAAFRITQDRIGEPELPDRGDDLLHLSHRMGARVARVGLEARGCSVGDRERARDNALALGCRLMHKAEVYTNGTGTATGAGDCGSGASRGLLARAGQRRIAFGNLSRAHDHNLPDTGDSSPCSGEKLSCSRAWVSLFG